MRADGLNVESRFLPLLQVSKTQMNAIMTSLLGIIRNFCRYQGVFASRLGELQESRCPGHDAHPLSLQHGSETSHLECES